MSNISEHPKFKSLLKVNSRCKGSWILFEYLLGSSKVFPYKMNNRLEYTSHMNPVFIECTTFPSHSFKDNCMNCFVCFTTRSMIPSSLVLWKGFTIMLWCHLGIVDGVLWVRECDDDLFWNVSTRFCGQPQATVHNFILGRDDHHFSMYFVNKVMGPHLKSDKEGAVNKEDNHIQHSAFGKEWNFLFLLLAKSHLTHDFILCRSRQIWFHMFDHMT